MRKIIYRFFAAALVVTSCENTVDKVWSDENEAILVVNAQIKQDQKRHFVRVECSEGGNCNQVEDAKVTCRINGGETITVPGRVQEHELFNGEVIEEFLGYGFDADLAAGDEISIQVSWKALTASATVKVPESKAKITALDTMRVVLAESGSYGGDTRTTRQYNITVKDKEGEKNYYMLAVRDVYYKLDAAGHRIASLDTRGYFDAKYDRMLHPLENELLDDIIDGDDNDYELFNDEMFADASYTLKVYDSYYGVYLDDFTRFFEQFDEGDRYCMDRLVKIYTIPFEEYLYLKAIGSAYSDLEFLTEPIIYPENVSGGLGFVAAITPEVWTIEFPVQTYTGEPPYNAYRYIDPMPEAPDYYYY